MGVYLDKQIDPKVADKIRKAGNEIINDKSAEESNIKYLAPEEIGIDYDNPESSIKYYEKKNNVKLYEQPNGSFKVVPQPYKSKYKSEDYEDARYYPVSDEDKKAAGPRYLGRYHSIFDAAGLNDNEPGSWKKERDMFKYVGDSDTGASIVQGPDGYFSGNPRINTMSFKTFEQAKNYLDRKNPEEHKYGVYFKPGDAREYVYRDSEDKYDLEAPDAYKNARETAKQKQTEKENASNQLFKIRENMDPNDKKIAEYMNNLNEDQLYWLYDALRSKFGK
jgi:hypothetical protein